ncbi:MAG TPA: hypothetical protein VF403_16750 [Kofleriaceae bacterium]
MPREVNTTVVVLPEVTTTRFASPAPPVFAVNMYEPGDSPLAEK